MPERNHLALLLRVNSILNSSESLDDILADLISRIIETLQAERGFVVLLQGQDWRIAASHHTEDSDPATLFSRTVVGKVAESGHGLFTIDAQSEPGMSSTSINVQSLISIVCAPLIWEGEVRGAVYADSKAKSGIFREPDLKVLEAIADQASRALEMSELHQKLQRIHRESLDQFEESAQLEESMGSIALNKVLQSIEGPDTKESSNPAASRHETLQIRLFGNLSVDCAGEPVTKWKSRKDRELFTYLALHHGKVTHEDVLIELFWKRGGKKARHSLHNCITQIRKVLGDDQRTLLQRRLEGYVLGEDSWLDVSAFEQAFEEGCLAVERGDWERALLLLREAEKLACDELLAESRLDWVVHHRTKFTQQLNDCRSLMARYFSERGKHLVAVELWKRVLALDNCNEQAYRGLLKANRALGRRAEMVKVLQACTKAYAEELDLPPPTDFEQLLDF